MKNNVVVLVLAFTFCSLVSCKKNNPTIRPKNIQSAGKILGLAFTPAERDSLVHGLNLMLDNYEKIRATSFPNELSPKFIFDPRPYQFVCKQTQENINWEIPLDIEIPSNKEELAFYPVSALASLLKNRKITSMELTQIYIDRLKKYGDTLKCVVCITESLAYEQARKADNEISMGNYRGPLHGVPYGIKDLFSVESYNTIWGANPYKNQSFGYTATVVKKLESAGAVLVAKLSLGALAMGDVWYGGTTKNPWDLTQGSSGSSAGSASATSAGLVAFAIGTETWGSIVSPSARCGVTGLRPTFGRVSRYGAMALSWTMDKVGPICRNACDCALVFDAIRGRDEKDPSTTEYPFNFNLSSDLKKLKVAYLKNLFEGEQYHGQANDSATLAVLRNIGIQLIETQLPQTYPVGPLSLILVAEAAAAFDELTRNNTDDQLVAQHKNAWPNIFREARFIPAVEYIQASRVRNLWVEEFNRFISQFDAIICPTFGGDQLLLTNLTGHPCVVLPNGPDQKGRPTSISIIGNLYDEAPLLLLANLYQKHTGFENTQPGFFRAAK